VIEMRLSAQGRTILQALDAAPEELVWMADLVELIARPQTRRGVTRASLSRTLRRLWRAGLVELLDDWTTLSARDEQARAKLAALEADPAAAYARHQEFWQSCGEPQYIAASVEDYMALRRANARPSMRVRMVRITAAGRASVNKGASEKLTDAANRHRRGAA